MPRAPACRRPASAACSGCSTDRIDLYLLHWRGSHPLAETVAAFEKLQRAGKIRYWGVSNFDADDMQELMRLQAGDACATNQVLYNPDTRGIEYRPAALVRAAAACRSWPIRRSARAGGCCARRRCARWRSGTMRRRRRSPSPGACGTRNVISIPKAVDPEHVRENAAAGEIVLTEEDLSRRSTPRIRRHGGNSRWECCSSAVRQCKDGRPHLSLRGAERQAISRHRDGQWRHA